MKTPNNFYDKSLFKQANRETDTLIDPLHEACRCCAPVRTCVCVCVWWKALASACDKWFCIDTLAYHLVVYDVMANGGQTRWAAFVYSRVKYQ